jgi:hypothetical protein
MGCKLTSDTHKPNTEEANNVWNLNIVWDLRFWIWNFALVMFSEYLPTESVEGTSYVGGTS